MRFCVIIDQWLIDRQIYKGGSEIIFEGSMTENSKNWWEGLGKELEVDIETFTETSS
ncbi:hypothetical protein NsoK4_01060 [Nitrosopumilus sp. K4]|uniref:hypothetical protein n=1 Tax=Nitrosopumilus sp. K4 TaxID=2795383 RepID=UPI001BA9E22B|nr:hypothetical protein [Nitrosopumilus sp. K4]QUC64903.1 hypothetical protein NsoK4_01060 [Nitrosopumilus sp. K4]